MAGQDHCRAPELGLPCGLQRSQAKDFRVEPERGGPWRMNLPQGLIHQQWLMTATGHVLRRPPGRRRMLHTLPDRTVKALACSWFSAWPSGLLLWLSPEAAAFHGDRLAHFARWQSAPLTVFSFPLPLYSYFDTTGPYR